MFVRAIPLILTFCLLAGAAVDKVRFRLSVPDSAPYHRSVREAMGLVPLRTDTWVGTDVEVPPAAIALLHPNVILSRRYEDVQTGRRVSLLIVQCTDARDLLGHYPPACYPGQGWLLGPSTQRRWPVDDWVIAGTQYEFASTRADRLANVAVYNFMVLPDGTTRCDMVGVDAAAKDVRRRGLGAAQVQMVCDSAIPLAERDAIFELLIRASRPLLDRIRAGVEK